MKLPSRRPVLGPSLALLAALPAACATIEVRSEFERAGASATYSTWAWAEDAGAGGAEAPRTQIRDTIASGLGLLGLEEVAEDEAELLVDFATSVETQARHNDPYFSLYVREEVELGTLTIELVEPRTGRRLWRGQGKSELRVSGVQRGLYAAEVTPTDEPRDWRVVEKVTRILAELESSQAGDRPGGGLRLAAPAP